MGTVRFALVTSRPLRLLCGGGVLEGGTEIDVEAEGAPRSAIYKCDVPGRIDDLSFPLCDGWLTCSLGLRSLGASPCWRLFCLRCCLALEG